MNNILHNSSNYTDLAQRYELDKNKWDKDKTQCLSTLLTAINSISTNRNYVIELSNGKEPCININLNSQSGRVRGRIAGIYATPTAGKVTLYLNENTYNHLYSKYELPEHKTKNGQPYYQLNFCELCSFIEAIITS